MLETRVRGRRRTRRAQCPTVPRPRRRATPAGSDGGASTGPASGAPGDRGGVPQYLSPRRPHRVSRGTTAARGWRRSRRLVGLSHAERAMLNVTRSHPTRLRVSRGTGHADRGPVPRRARVGVSVGTNALAFWVGALARPRRSNRARGQASWPPHIGRSRPDLLASRASAPRVWKIAGVVLRSHSPREELMQRRCRLRPPRRSDDEEPGRVSWAGCRGVRGERACRRRPGPQRSPPPWLTPPFGARAHLRRPTAGARALSQRSGPPALSALGTTRFTARGLTSPGRRLACWRVRRSGQGMAAGRGRAGADNRSRQTLDPAGATSPRSGIPRPPSADTRCCARAGPLFHVERAPDRRPPRRPHPRPRAAEGAVSPLARRIDARTPQSDHRLQQPVTTTRPCLT